MSRWVQHISGQGAKYELTDSMWNRADNSSWETRNNTSNNLSWFYLPRFEYRECQSPRRRVTGEMEVSHAGTLIHKEGGTRASFHGTAWKLLRKEDLADGEVCLVIEEGE